jgi:hypothetical protein
VAVKNGPFAADAVKLLTRMEGRQFKRTSRMRDTWTNTS